MLFVVETNKTQCTVNIYNMFQTFKYIYKAQEHECTIDAMKNITCELFKENTRIYDKKLTIQKVYTNDGTQNSYEYLIVEIN